MPAPSLFTLARPHDIHSVLLAVLQMSSLMSVHMWGSCDEHSTSSHHEQHSDCSDEEVSSCCAHDIEQYQQQLVQPVPLHRVKRVWSHLCKLEQLDDDVCQH